MTSNATDVVIVGGGAAGCAVAYYLGIAGVASTIVEREAIAAYASGYSAGGLNPLEGAGIPGPLGPLAITSHRMHQGIWDDLIERSRIDFQPEVISSVRVAFDASDLDAMRETKQIFDHADSDFSAEWLDSGQLRELEPRIADDAIWALDTRGNAILSSHSYTLALAAAAETLGASVVSAAVTGIISNGARVTSVETSEGSLACGSVVFATGPWSGQAGDWLGVGVPVEPYKGEILRTTLASGSLSADFQGRGVSLNHRESGQVWVGATEENRGFDLEPSEQARKTLMNGALHLMPAMADAVVVLHTACLRPLSPDWMPVLGPAPGWDNAFLATGAGKKGILLSPGIGKSVADLILDGRTDLPVSGFSPDRFSVNERLGAS
jgi:glycine oxidase